MKNNLIGKIKHTYELLFHVDDIEIPKGLTPEEQEKFVSGIYKEKARLHEKLGAKKFQRFIEGFDRAKYRFLKNVIGEERVIKYYDKATDRYTKKKLEKATTEQERKKIIEQSKRAKALMRIQMKEERSANYYVGVDRRAVDFSEYIKYNKRVHQGCLKRNGIILTGCIALGALGAPLLPVTLLGGYQIITGFKNLQCINNQEYYLARKKASKKRLESRKLRSLKKTYDENQNLISELQRAKEAGIDLYDIKAVIDFIGLNAAKELLAAFEAERKNQAAITSKHKQSEQEGTKTTSDASSNSVLADKIVERMATESKSPMVTEAPKQLRR